MNCLPSLPDRRAAHVPMPRPLTRHPEPAQGRLPLPHETAYGRAYELQEMLDARTPEIPD